MFLNQSEYRDKNIPLKWKETYEKWRRENPDDVKLKGRAYVDAGFLQFVYESWMKDGSYSQEFGELIDLIIRKMMTTQKYLQTSDQQKQEFYSKAIEKVYKYGIKSYKKEKGNFFTYVTSTIRTAFYDVIKEDQSQYLLAKKIYKDQRSSLLATNIEDPNDMDSVLEDLKDVNSSTLTENKAEIVEKYKVKAAKYLLDSLEQFKYQPCDITKCELGEYYITENSELKYTPHLIDGEEVLSVKLKNGNIIQVPVVVENSIVHYNKHSFIVKKKQILVNNPNAAVFRREKFKYQYQIIINPKNKYSKGIMLEVYHLLKTNEQEGTRPSELFNQAYIARKFGWHYFGVISDEFDAVIEGCGEDILGRDILAKKLSDLFEATLKQFPYDTSLELNRTYIDNSLIEKARKLKEIEQEAKDLAFDKTWWGVNADRTKRVLLINNIDVLTEFREADELHTRVYDFGRFKKDIINDIS